jgi:hypothetical protein
MLGVVGLRVSQDHRSPKPSLAAARAAAQKAARSAPALRPR